MDKDLLNQELTLIGETNFRDQKKRFGIKRDDRRRHMYVIGKTGMGKTTFLENMIISDLLKGEGCCYIDPHGDTAEKLLSYIPANRINDVIYFNPADSEFPIAFNILEAVNEKEKHLIASGIVGVFKKQFAESWGPRLEYILRNAVLALLDYPGSTLLGIMRILVDKEYREKVVEKIKDPVVKSFWVNEYTKWNDRTLQEVISPIQNKVGQFLSNFLIRNIVGQVKSTIDMRDILDNQKILILNLSKGRIGEDTMQLLGSMIVTKLYLAAMSRVDIPETERKDFFLYVDEFQNFATDSFADILSEARKYRLDLVMAHQYIEQLPETVSAAIFGNVGTLVSFRVGAADAELLVREFTPVFTEEDLVNLPAFNVYLRLMIDGIASDPFSANSLPPLFKDMKTGNEEKVIKVSRERYTTPRNVVEEKINRWSGMDLSENLIKTVGRAEFDEPDEKHRLKMKATREEYRTERNDHARQDREKNQHSSEEHRAPEREYKTPERDHRPADKTYQSTDHSHQLPPPLRSARPPLGHGGIPIEHRPPAPNQHQEKKPDHFVAEKNKKPFTADCAVCGTVVPISFKPDGVRPIFCDNCLNSMVRAENQPNSNIVVVRDEAKKDNPVMSLSALKTESPNSPRPIPRAPHQSQPPRREEHRQQPSHPPRRNHNDHDLKPGQVVKL